MTPFGGLIWVHTSCFTCEDQRLLPAKTRLVPLRNVRDLLKSLLELQLKVVSMDNEEAGSQNVTESQYDRMVWIGRDL